MFGKLAADALGLSDIGKIISPKDFDKVDTDDYILREEGEKIYFLIKSRSDEYCFTNLGLIHLDGSSALSKKRLLKRYNYARHQVENVQLETAGTVDLDVEIKFVIGDTPFSIDVTKNQLEQLKTLYKILLKISAIQYANNHAMSIVAESLETAKGAVGRSSTGNITDSFKQVYEFIRDTRETARENYVKKDFSEVYEKYLGNQ
jgi:hypothetical protein